MPWVRLLWWMILKKNYCNYGNAVFVKEFIGQKDDDELIKLLKYLEVIGEVENVRKVDKLHWYKNSLNYYEFIAKIIILEDFPLSVQIRIGC